MTMGYFFLMFISPFLTEKKTFDEKKISFFVHNMQRRMFESALIIGTFLLSALAISLFFYDIFSFFKYFQKIVVSFSWFIFTLYTLHNVHKDQIKKEDHRSFIIALCIIIFIFVLCLTQIGRFILSCSKSQLKKSWGNPTLILAMGLGSAYVYVFTSNLKSKEEYPFLKIILTLKKIWPFFFFIPLLLTCIRLFVHGYYSFFSPYQSFILLLTSWLIFFYILVCCKKQPSIRPIIGSFVFFCFLGALTTFLNLNPYSYESCEKHIENFLKKHQALDKGIIIPLPSPQSCSLQELEKLITALSILIKKSQPRLHPLFENIKTLNKDSLKKLLKQHTSQNNVLEEILKSLNLTKETIPLFYTNNFIDSKSWTYNEDWRPYSPHIFFKNSKNK